MDLTLDPLTFEIIKGGIPVVATACTAFAFIVKKLVFEPLTEIKDEMKALRGYLHDYELKTSEKHFALEKRIIEIDRRIDVLEVRSGL